jgi:hypothetical protein
MRVTLSLPERATAEELIEEAAFMKEVLDTIVEHGEEIVVHLAIDPATVAESSKPWDRSVISITQNSNRRGQLAPDLYAVREEDILLKTATPRIYDYE